MASTGARVVLRQRKQLIKFPNRIQIHKNPNANSKGPELSPAIAAINTQQVPSFKPLNTPSSTDKVPVTNSSIYEDFVSLPIRFQRKLISQEEMEYIEKTSDLLFAHAASLSYIASVDMNRFILVCMKEKKALLVILQREVVQNDKN